MSMNDTPSSNRVHIGLFGQRNAGKSSLVNAITAQNLAVVSPLAGTTTDPVSKTMELLPLGPCVFIDTPGIDDYGELGSLRVEKTQQVLAKTDIALLVVDAKKGITKDDEKLISMFDDRKINYIVVYNKCDLLEKDELYGLENQSQGNTIYVSSKGKINISRLKDMIAALGKSEEEEKPLIGDLVNSGDLVVLVVPIDSSAPKGRLILPQQQVIRDGLEKGAVSLVVKDTELEKVIEDFGDKIKLVITDSQAFAKVMKVVPETIPLTSFSIIFARYKGQLLNAIKGAKAIDNLKNGSAVLISEGCTHHRQCEDIGTVKLPKWIRDYTNKNIDFHFSSGMEFPEELEKYDLIIHCGGCMLNEKEMKHRMNKAILKKVPMTNYGTAIAYMNGILDRSIEPVKSTLK